MLISLHKQGTTTPKIRAAIQASDDLGTVLAERFGVAPQTIYKWYKRDTVQDRSHTPHRRQTILKLFRAGGKEVLSRLIFMLLLAANAAHARECTFSTMCVDDGECEGADFLISYEHTGVDDQGQTARMNLPSLPWIPIYRYKEPYVIRGHLSQAEQGERHYYFQGIGTGFMLTLINGKAVLTIHARNARPDPPFITGLSHLAAMPSAT